MKTTIKMLAAAALLAGLSTLAHAQEPHAGHGAPQGGTMQPMEGMNSGMDPAIMQGMMRGMMPSEDDAPSTRAVKEEHMKMMRDMHMTYSGNPDVDFAGGMIPHHRGAIRATWRVQAARGQDRHRLVS